MRVAALYDIHGNLPALEAVLEEIQRIGMDEVVIGGDVLVGPMQVECLERLRSLWIPTAYIRGNADREAVATRRGQENPKLPPFALEMLRWSARQLRDDDARFVATWPLTAALEIPPLGRVLFCHATPRDDDEGFTATTPEDRLVPIFEAANADIVVCGHTHMQFDRMVGRTRVVNAGSVGMPFGPPFGACWILLGDDIELRQTEYDHEAAAERIRATEYPDAPNFSIINPPTAEAMLAAYSKMPLNS